MITKGRFEALMTGLKLFSAHFDAWATTWVITQFALWSHDAFTARAQLLALCITVGYWLAFAANDFYDAADDALDVEKGRRNFFVGVRVSERVLWLGVAVVVLPMVPVFMGLGRAGIPILFICLLVAWAYSAPPLRLKNRPLLDLLTHTLFVESFPYVLMMLLLRFQWQAFDWLIVGMAMAASMTAQLEQQLRDYEVDVMTGGSFAIWLGRDRTRHLLQLITSLLFALGLYGIAAAVIPLKFLPIGLLATPPLLHRFIRGNRPRSQKMTVSLISIGFLYMLLLTWWA